MLTRSTRSGAASHARDRLTGTSHGHSLITHGCSLITHGCSLYTHGCSLITHGCSLITHGCSLITHGCSLVTRGCSLITHGCRLYAQGLANVAPPLVLDTAAAAEQRPQQVGTRALLLLFCAPPLATPASPGCLPGAGAVLPQLPPLPAGRVPSWERHSLAAPPPWAGTAGSVWLWVTRRTLEERPYRAEPRQGHTRRRLGARCGS